MKLANLLLWIFLTAFLSNNAGGETVYFLVAEKDSPTYNDSYVLPLSDACDITHARNLISGSETVETIVVADIAAGPDGINRNYLSSFRAPWNWGVTEFNDFAEIPTGILDGWPGGVQNDLQTWIADTGGQIGFSNYTVVADLGTHLKAWQCDFNTDRKINFKDFAYLGVHYGDCNASNPCGAVDVDDSGAVDYNDASILFDDWLVSLPVEPMWFPDWNNPYQCHGDADGQEQGSKFGGYYRVGTDDLAILMATWPGGPLPIVYPDLDYDPRVDFDRDGDIDANDVNILEYWLQDPDVPADCAAETYP